MSQQEQMEDKEYNYKKIGAPSEQDKPESLLCPVCQNVCSAHAASCPKCGHPIKTRMPETPNNSGQTAIRILWVLFVISFLFSFSAIRIYNNMLYDTGGPLVRAERQADIIGIAVRVALPVTLGFILVLVYAVRGKR